METVPVNYSCWLADQIRESHSVTTLLNLRCRKIRTVQKLCLVDCEAWSWHFKWFRELVCGRFLETEIGIFSRIIKWRRPILNYNVKNQNGRISTFKMLRYFYDFRWCDLKFWAWCAVSAPKIIELLFFEETTMTRILWPSSSPDLNSWGRYLWRTLTGIRLKNPHPL
jgi:hypothetical protein